MPETNSPPALGLSDAILKQVDHDNAARLLAARG